MGAELGNRELVRLNKRDVQRLIVRSKIPDGGRNPEEAIDGGFPELILELARAFMHERRIQKLESQLTINELRMLIHAELMAATFPGKPIRLDGTSTHKNHLHGTSMNLIQDGGRTRLYLIMGGNLHDLPEVSYGDMSLEPPEGEMAKDNIFTTFEQFLELWRGTFKDPNDPLCFGDNPGDYFKDVVKPVLRKLWSLITAVKKEKNKNDRDWELAATLRKWLGAIAGRGLNVYMLKVLGDRLSNMRAINSQKEGRKKPIAEETYEIHCRLGTYFGFGEHPAIQEMTNGAARLLNENLLEGFTRLRDRTVDQHLDRPVVGFGDASTVRDHLTNIFDARKGSGRTAKLLGRVEEIGMVPAELSDFSLREEKPLKELSLADLNIASFDPLFEYVVILKPGTKSHSMVRHIQKCCGKDPDKEPTPLVVDEKVPRGIRFTIQSERFGVLKFRINDSVSEARSKRGIIQPTKKRAITDVEDPLPEELGGVINRILEETRGGTREQAMRTVPLARELLLRPTITVFTPPPEVQAKTFPLGATGLDFANSVHSEFVSLRIRLLRHEPGGRFVQVNPLEPLDAGCTYEVVEVETDESLSGVVQPGPENIYFCQTDSARHNLRKRLRHNPKTDPTAEGVISRGRQYVKKLEQIFGIQHIEFMGAIGTSLSRKIIPTMPEESMEDKLYHVLGTAQADPLTVLSQRFFSDRKVWNIEVGAKNEPGIIHDFTSGFKQQHINVENFRQVPDPDDHEANILSMQLHHDERKTPFDIMRLLLKLSSRYDVKVISDYQWGWEELAEGQRGLVSAAVSAGAFP